MSNAKEIISKQQQHAATKNQTAASPLERSKRVSLVTSIYSHHSQSTNDIPKISGNAPTHLQTWEHQNRVRINSGGALSQLYPVKTTATTSTSSTSSSGPGRRILPSPASNKSQGENDRAARTVRQLLAKHQENINYTQGSESNGSSPKNKSPNGDQVSSVNRNVKTVPTSKANQETNGHGLSSAQLASSSYLKKVQNIPNMPHQQPSNPTRYYSPNRKYTLTNDLASSSDEDDVNGKEYRNDNSSSAVDGSVSRGSSQIPGDSFPSTAHQLHAVSIGDDIEDGDMENGGDNRLELEEFLANGNNDINDTEQELLRRLSQGQARMEQIKRMLVNQRGFIVESLKQLAVSNIVLGHQNGQRDEDGTNGDTFKPTCANCQKTSYSSSKDSYERDRTLGRTVAITDFNSAANNKPKTNGTINIPIEPESEINSAPKAKDFSQAPTEHDIQVSGTSRTITINNGDPVDLTTSSALYNGMRLCPMCEASFPPNSVSQEDFELHVVEHFNFDEAETLRYIPPSSSSSSTAEYSSGGGGGS